MKRWVVIPLILALCLLAPHQWAAESPRLQMDGAQQWILKALPAILDDEEVSTHLTSGLTTSFDFRLNLKDRKGVKIQGAAVIQIRYDPWDEVFHVKSLGIDGRGRRQTAASKTALHEWWNQAEIPILNGTSTSRASSTPIRLTLEVVPFSQAEQKDFQRWFSEGLDQAGQSSAEEVGNAEESTDRLSSVLNVLMATSIQRRALKAYHWSLEYPAQYTEGTSVE